MAAWLSASYRQPQLASALGLLAAARHGLLETELIALLEPGANRTATRGQQAQGGEEALLEGEEERASFSLLFAHLYNFFSAGGTGYLVYFHSQILYAIQHRYKVGR